jgi:hypothetical protein
MRDRAIESMRLVLTIIGLLFLVIFGTKAVGQVGNLKLAGANHRFEQPTSVPILNLASLALEPGTLQAAKAAFTSDNGTTHPKPQPTIGSERQKVMPNGHQAAMKSTATVPAEPKKTKAEIPAANPTPFTTYPAPVAPRPVQPPRPGNQP